MAKHRLVSVRAQLRHYLACYLTDTTTTSALERCAKRHRNLLATLHPSATVADLQAMDDDVVQPLIAAIDAFIEAYGLARFSPSVLMREQLRDIILGWLIALRDVVSVTTLPSLPIRLPARPPIPTMTSAERRIAVTLTDEWDPERETRKAAMERITSQIRTSVARQIDAVAVRYEEQGFRFMRDRNELPRHCRWLFLRVAREMSSEAIEILERGSGHHVTARAIQDTTQQLAREIGVRLPKARTRRQ